jgi:hypothetical protein
MTLLTLSTRIDYAADGVTDEFAVPFPFFEAADLVVVERVTATGAETTLAIGTHYTVTGGGGVPGAVLAVTAPAAGRTWIIIRQGSPIQPLDYVSNDPFPAETHEKGLDRGAALAQDVRRDVGRTLRARLTETLAEIPVQTARANRLLGFDASGQPVAADVQSTVSISEVQALADAAAASATAAAGDAADAATEAANAAAAASAAMGPMVLTGVAGTSTAYTASATYSPSAGRFYVFRPNVTSGVAPVTLSINATTPRQLRQGDGTQAWEGMAQAGRDYLLYFTTGNLFVVLGEYVTETHVRPITRNRGLRAPGDTADRVQEQTLIDGRVLWRLGGDGTTLPAQKVEFQADGTIRTITGRYINAGQQEVFHPGNPPRFYRDIQAAIEPLLARNWEEAISPRQISGTERYTISGADIYLDVISGSMPIDARGMAIGQRVLIDIRSGATPIFLAPQAWAGTNDGLARGNATFTSVVSGNAASTFTFTAGDPVAEGYAVGDQVQFTNLAATANNGVAFSIQAFSGTSNRTVTVSPPPVTDAVPDASFTMTRTGARKLAPTAGTWEIIRKQTEFLAVQLAAFATKDTATLPAPGIVLAANGQSWDVRFTRHMLMGWQETRSALSLSRDTHVIEGTAFGASAVLAGAADPNYLWDQIGAAPGPNALACRDAILADPHRVALAWFWICHGLGDLANFAETGNNTPAAIVSARRAFADWLTAQTGLAPSWMVCPGPPGQDQSETVYPSDRWWPMRDAHRQLWDADSRFKRGPEFYDLQRNRRGERHYPFAEAARFGRRLALYHANYAHAQSNWLGPRITSWSEVSPTLYELTIDYGVGKSVQVPDVPAGVRIIPSSSEFAAPLPIARYSRRDGVGTTIILSCHLAGAGGTGARPAFPWGPMEEAQAQSTIIQALHPLTDEYMPLQTFSRTGS